MFNFIVNYFNKTGPNSAPNPEPKMASVNHDNDVLFNKQYRTAYNKLWINKLRTYRP